MQNSELVSVATPRELKQLRAGAIPQLEDRTACQSPSVDARDMSEIASDITISPVSEPKLLRAGVWNHAKNGSNVKSLAPQDAPVRDLPRNGSHSPARANSESVNSHPSLSAASKESSPTLEPPHVTSILKQNVQPEIETNRIVVEPVSTPKEFNIRDIKHMRDVDDRPYGLANLKIGLHATEAAAPSWQFALLDSGCTDNLVSMKSLQAMADFAQAKITTSTAKTLRTANNDESQLILGRVTLLISLIDTKEKRTCFRIPFLVVSGLTHDIFLGQPFLTSGHIIKETREALYFRSDSEMESSEAMIIPKIYLSKRKASCAKRILIPPSSAAKVKTNLVMLPELHDELFATFRPSEKFLETYPDLHMVYQTVLVEPNDPISVMVVNVTDKPIAIKHSSNLGYYETFPKVGTFVHSLSDFMSDNLEPFVDPNPQDLNNCIPQCLSLQPIEAECACDDFDSPDHECNAAYTASLHDHQLTPEEKEARNAQYRNEGYFQKTVTEVVNQSNNMPSFNYEGENQFENKTDSQLLADIDLEHLKPDQRKLTLEMLKRNLDAFQRHALDIGCCSSVTAYAPLNTPDPPILYTKYVPIPAKYKAPAQALIDRYVQAGVLAPTTDPCKLTSNIFIIPKKDGSFRLIFDGRLVSRFCQSLPLSLGNLDELFSNLAGKTLVSKLDVSQAYYQIGITKETSQLLSFFGPDSRRYVFLRTGQGLKFSSFFMTQVMDKILFGIPEARSYCDDVFIATDKSFKHHLGVLEKVIKSFKANNVRLNIGKLEIAPPNLDFLGLTWTRDKLSIPKSKITGYLNMKKPTSLKQARFLVNSMAYYRRFIPRFSHHINPILELLKENPKKFYWTKEHQDAVDKLISIIEHGVSIYLPQFDKPFIIHTDASYCALGATVSQYDKDGHLRLVAAVSRSFIKSERRLAPVQKEVLGLLYTLTSLHYFLKGHHLIIYADARSLTLLKTCSASSPYLARLAMELSAYDFELYHLEGSLNIEADALSRLHKLEDKILSDDKLINDAMTKEESLLFLEFLKIPSDYRFTVPEVRHMLTSEPLRTQLQTKIKARNAGCLKTAQNNSPTTIKPKKVHEPRYSDSHPMEDPNFVARQQKKHRSKLMRRPKRVISNAIDVSKIRALSPSLLSSLKGQRRSKPTQRVRFASPLCTIIPGDCFSRDHSPNFSRPDSAHSQSRSRHFSPNDPHETEVSDNESVISSDSSSSGTSQGMNFVPETIFQRSSQDPIIRDLTLNRPVTPETVIIQSMRHSFNHFSDDEMSSDDDEGRSDCSSVNSDYYPPDDLISELDIAMTREILHVCDSSSCALHGQIDPSPDKDRPSSSSQQFSDPVTEPFKTASASLADDDPSLVHCSRLRNTRSPMPNKTRLSESLPTQKSFLTSDNEHSENSQSSLLPNASHLSEDPLSDCLSIETPLAIPEVYALNSTVGIDNPPLAETLEELQMKTQIVNTGQLSNDDFAAAQNLDVKILELKERYVPEHTHLKLCDNILYRKSKDTFLPILPQSLETFLFNCQHFHVLSGHRSADSMLKSISEQFYVPQLKQKLKEFTRNCYICSLSKSQRMEKNIQGTTTQALYPKHILSFDIFGAVEPDEQGFRYVYSFIDNFSLFVINIKAKTRTTEEILAAFLQIFAIYSSLPQIVCSDQETALMSPKARDFFSSFGITHNPGASHAHWRLLSEGASIRKSKEFMRSVLLANATHNWFQALQLATIALNNTKTFYNYTPIQLFFGNSKSQIDLFQSAAKYTDLDAYVSETSERFNAIIEAVNLRRKQSVEKRNELINAHRKEKQFSVGSLVWLKALNISPNRATKMQNHGPFVILQKINEHTFKLATIANPQVCARISHASHLEAFENSVDLTPINFPRVKM